jgi:hypothetical protein
VRKHPISVVNAPSRPSHTSTASCDTPVPATPFEQLPPAAVTSLRNSDFEPADVDVLVGQIVSLCPWCDQDCAGAKRDAHLLSYRQSEKVWRELADGGAR